MKENKNDKNIWTDKLGDLPVPEANPMWDEMKRRLDREMPVKKKDNRWIAGLLILLLFIGVCTYQSNWMQDDGVKQTSRHKEPGKQAASHPGTGESPQAHSEKPGTHMDASAPVASYNIKEQPKRDSVAADATSDDGRTRVQQKAVGHSPVSGNRRIGGYVTATPATNKRNSKYDKRAQRDNQKRIVPGGNPLKNDPSSQPRQNINDVANQPVKPSLQADSTHQRSDSVVQAKDQPQKIDSLKINKDSASKKEKDIRFAFAVGFNQFFALGNQEKANFNSNGQTGTWSDYLPVPQVRVYYGKRWYAQLEAQFNTPQYTKQLVADNFVSDTNSLGQREQRTVYIKKLFYFNLPFSVHYRVTPHINIGAGLQFSRLTSTIGLVEQSTLTINRPDSIVSSKIMELSSDSVAQRLRTNEFRFLVDAGYQWKKFHAGIRYNQAFTPFINYEVSHTQITQARNNSLQLYLRYTFFEK